MGLKIKCLQLLLIHHLPLFDSGFLFSDVSFEYLMFLMCIHFFLKNL